MTQPDNEERPPAANRAGARKLIDTTSTKVNLTSLGVPKADMETWINVAIVTDAIVYIAAAHLVIVPDTILLEAEANSNPYRPTTLLRRADGREAAIYRFSAVKP